MVSIEKAKGRAGQLKSEVEQAMARATESMETQARGVVDEAKGKALEAVADLKGEVTKGAGEAQDQFGEISGKAQEQIGDISNKAQEQLAAISGRAQAAMPELSRTNLALLVAGVVVVLALVGAWFGARARRAAQRASEA